MEGSNTYDINAIGNIIFDTNINAINRYLLIMSFKSFKYFSLKSLLASEKRKEKLAINTSD
jgi:hypothetical protein